MVPLNQEARELDPELHLPLYPPPFSHIAAQCARM